MDKKGNKYAKIKEVERLLFKYKKIPLMIQKMELEIEIINHTYEGIKGKSNNEIIAGSRTNVTNSPVENSIIRKELKIEDIKEQIDMLKFEERSISIALNNLTDIELGIISDKYFDNMSYFKVGVKHYFSKEWAYYTCQRIIKEKILPYMACIVDEN